MSRTKISPTEPDIGPDATFLSYAGVRSQFKQAVLSNATNTTYVLLLGLFLQLEIPVRETVYCIATATAVGHNTSAAINTTGTTLLIAVTGGYHAVGISSGYLSDSGCNVWQYASVFGNSLILFMPQPITSSSHTFTFNALPLTIQGGLYRSGTSTVYPFAAQNGVILSAASTTVQAGSVAPIESGDLIVIDRTTSREASLSASINDGFQTRPYWVPRLPVSVPRHCNW
jgi:hypothetical protein